MDADPGVTDQLLAWRAGDLLAGERFFETVYESLRRMAHRQLGGERVDHTLDTNALVHEAFLRLVDQTRVEWNDRAHFFAIAAQAMRRILVDSARRVGAVRHGGGLRQVSLDDETAMIGRTETLLALDDALDRLARLDERLSRVVECRYFAGLTDEETATALGVTARTVQRDWVKARAWLSVELQGT
jgi:RNA polymerase sigma factor (TIGR02999 family)